MRCDAEAVAARLVPEARAVGQGRRAVAEQGPQRGDEDARRQAVAAGEPGKQAAAVLGSLKNRVQDELVRQLTAAAEQPSAPLQLGELRETLRCPACKLVMGGAVSAPTGDSSRGVRWCARPQLACTLAGRWL